MVRDDDEHRMHVSPIFHGICAASGLDRGFIGPDRSAIDLVVSPDGKQVSGVGQNDDELGQNSPNPFNPETTNRYALDEPSHVRIVIYNLIGHVVHVLADANQPVGFHTVHWNGRNAHGKQVFSGVYLYQIEAGTLVDARKILLIK